MNVTRPHIDKHNYPGGWALAVALVSVMTGLKVERRRVLMPPTCIYDNGEFAPNKKIDAAFIDNARKLDLMVLALPSKVYRQAEEDGLLVQPATSMLIEPVEDMYDGLGLAFGLLDNK